MMHPDQYCFLQLIMASIFSTYIFWKSALGTSCPDARRADHTNNSSFYYCIDLPFSATGHIWIPATCNYGLVFNPLLKMCVLPQETPCSHGKVKAGNTNKHTFEEKDIESPNTAPDAAAVILSFLHSSGNVHHQTLHTATSTNTDTPLQLSTRPPHASSTNNLTILPHLHTNQCLAEYQHSNYCVEHTDNLNYNLTNRGGHEKPVTTVTPSITTTNQIQHISITEGFSTSTNSFSTGSFHSQWNPALNIPCTTGVRMPNFTDCTRYYICNSTSSIILSYTCPPNMAFNVYKHVCEIGVYNWCKNQTTIFSQLIMSQPLEQIHGATTPRPSPCSKPGKTPDPHSRQHYFICHFQSNRIVSYRMSCPNKLQYCASERVCRKQNDCSE